MYHPEITGVGLLGRACVVGLGLLMCAAMAPSAAWAYETNVVASAKYEWHMCPTNDITADGKIAYCVTQRYYNVASGTYEASDKVHTLRQGDEELLRAALWFSWGAPGFTAAAWPEQGLAGMQLVDKTYHLWAQTLLSYIHQNSDTWIFYYGGTPGYAVWARPCLLGQPSEYHDNTNSTMNYVKAHMNEVPDWFQLVEIKTGVKGQRLISYQDTREVAVEPEPEPEPTPPVVEEPSAPEPTEPAPAPNSTPTPEAPSGSTEVPVVKADGNAVGSAVVSGADSKVSSAPNKANGVASSSKASSGKVTESTSGMRSVTVKVGGQAVEVTPVETVEDEAVASSVSAEIEPVAEVMAVEAIEITEEADEAAAVEPWVEAVQRSEMTATDDKSERGVDPAVGVGAGVSLAGIAGAAVASMSGRRMDEPETE